MNKTRILVDYCEDAYHRQRHPEFLQDEALYKAWSYFALSEYIEPFSPRTALEVGGAGGWNLVEAQETGVDCEMVEPSNLARTEAEKRGVRGHATLEDVGEKKFDLVLLRHVLEHLDEPFKTLNELRAYIAPGGILEIVLPVEKATEAPNALDKNFHLYCWNPQTITNLLVRCGYTITEWRFGYFTGRRILLPLWNKNMKRQYVWGLRLLGRVLNARELIIVAMPCHAHTDMPSGSRGHSK